MNEDEILDLIKTRLRLDVVTRSNYTGGMDGQPLYADSHTVQLLLDDVVISEVSL